MAGERILVVEDDSTLRRALVDNLKLEGYSVREAADGDAGFELAMENKADLLILDIMLPKRNGFEICQAIRGAHIEVPTLILTAKDQESDIVLGLNLGADDYVTKPFGLRELLARVNALLRRRQSRPSRTINFGEYELQVDAARLLKAGREVKLTPKEYALLLCLAEHPGQVRTRENLLNLVWQDVYVTERSVDRCVTTLRKKIERDPDNPAFIKTVREIGYRFETGSSH